MEDENPKEENQASTSKKESQRASAHELYDDRVQDDAGTNSETLSATYSARSRIEMADNRVDVPKPPNVKRERETKTARNKKKGRRSGRVEKRRRSVTRRQMRRMPRRKMRVREEKKERDVSVSTIFSRLSSRTGGSRTPGCLHCGHRCCRRRFNYYWEIWRRCRSRKMQRRKIRKERRSRKKRVFKYLTPRISGSEEIQAGSRSVMFSPLYVRAPNTEVSPDTIQEKDTYCEVSPQMICQSIRRLSGWRQNVTTEDLMNYIQRRYPVNPVSSELMEELREKLRVAVIVGLIIQVQAENWCLSCELEERALTADHVDVFWRAYGDTLKPIPRKPEMPKPERKDNLTNTENDSTREYAPNDLI
ncbi:uncharacterized protein LOC142980156 [Anticarsia gemmatalis]|uniref:uncharacterized protein LOC142980156 n=1 Tax=Anticarsia gemmatalis TaxID=129554 RepID=UPI003F768BA6